MVQRALHARIVIIWADFEGFEMAVAETATGVAVEHCGNFGDSAADLKVGTTTVG
jgi:hypothetical protein